jgi:hypothetical protein
LQAAESDHRPGVHTAALARLAEGAEQQLRLAVALACCGLLRVGLQACARLSAQQQELVRGWAGGV